MRAAKAIPCLLLCFQGMAGATAQSAAIQQLIDSVNIDSMTWHLERLSGMQPVDVGNGADTIRSRNTFNVAGHALANAWLLQQFSALGYSPSVQVFGTTGRNIVVEKPGLVHPERKVVICAHYDDMPGGPVNAPGADDNGSGDCAVLEAARLFAARNFENTVVFALWDQEEQGLIGSAYYTSVAGGNDVQVTAAVNMDAIGYDGNGDGVMRIYTGPVANSRAIKDTALMVNTTYGLGLPITIEDPGPSLSDHFSFWSEGYGAIMVAEDYLNDLNPHYHTPTDLIQYMDLPYWHGLARLGIGTAAVMAVPYDSTMGIEGPSAKGQELQLFPDPASTVLNLGIERGGEGPMELSLTDAWGRRVRKLRIACTAGVLEVDIRDLSPGAYTVRLSDASAAWAARFVKTP